MNFEYETKPQLQFQAEGYQRGPIHVGTTRITWRNYAWTMDQIKNYRDMRERMDFEAISQVDTSLREVMDALGTDMMNYIDEVKRELSPPSETKKEDKKAFMPFSEISKSVKETFGFDITKYIKDIIPAKKDGKEDKMKKEYGSAAGTANFLTFLHYNIFKKANGLLSW